MNSPVRDGSLTLYNVIVGLQRAEEILKILISFSEYMYLPYNTLSALERRGINSVVIMIILMLIKHFQEKTLRVIFSRQEMMFQVSVVGKSLSPFVEETF